MGQNYSTLRNRIGKGGKKKMKTKLTTDWICIAMSGKTADGREIKAEHLEQMAKAYDKNLYTAQIWLEHYRYIGSNYGIVEALETRTEGDKVKLFAKISPSKELLGLNARGIGLFTSIEINPKFADTKAAYLVGLAITDSPASLGTTQLQFNQRTGVQGVIVSDPLQFSFTIGTADRSEHEENEEQAKDEARKHLFSWMFNRGKKGEKPSTESAPEQNEDTQEMTNEQMQAFAQMVVASVTAGVANAFKQEQEKPEEKVTITKSEYNALKAGAEKAGDLESRVAEIEKQFSALRTQAVTTVPVGATNSFAINTAI